MIHENYRANLGGKSKERKSKTVRDKMLNKPPHRRKPKSPLPSDPKSVADANPFLPPLS